MAGACDAPCYAFFNKDQPPFGGGLPYVDGDSSMVIDPVARGLLFEFLSLWKESTPTPPTTGGKRQYEGIPFGAVYRYVPPGDTGSAGTGEEARR